MKRISRFAEVWFWLLRQHIEHRPSLFIQSICFGVGSRLGTIAGFVAVIKVIIWLLEPNQVPAILNSLLPASGFYKNLILSLSPAAIFLAQAVFQFLHFLKLKALKNDLLEHLLKKITKHPLQTHIHNIKPLTTDPGIQIRQHVGTITSTTDKLVQIITMSSVLLAVVAVSFFINWRIMTIVITVSSILTFIFLIAQQKLASKRAKDMKDAKQKEKEALDRIVSFHDKDSQVEDHQEKDSFRFNELYSSAALLSNSRAQTSLIMNVGQSLMITVFIVTILMLEPQSSSISWLAVLALMFRFSIGYATSILRDLSSLFDIHPKVSLIYKLATQQPATEKKVQG